MDEPTVAEGWPDRPLSGEETRDLLDDEVTTVHVMDHDPATRGVILGDDDPGPDESIVELVLETDDEYRMYSYTRDNDGTRWMDYGTERKGTDGEEQMQATLGSYRVFASRET
ncbi:hypothetical protein AUR64_12615 [Haloprofundus marisrubri]|uniref:Uncharacterized protein n=1 Tax=Haloprofundus marisrubri TaxID=1514971 RepID=A0A0W1RCR1_9EURY|nr:hypothetical protein [Haloprofundus marisrubri]KTG10403.1 hypothetical protein AUR64_12615 [Haloprofundus marisrubri]